MGSKDNGLKFIRRVLESRDPWYAKRQLQKVFTSICYEFDFSLRSSRKEVCYFKLCKHLVWLMPEITGLFGNSCHSCEPEVCDVD